MQDEEKDAGLLPHNFPQITLVPRKHRVLPIIAGATKGKKQVAMAAAPKPKSVYWMKMNYEYPWN